MLAPTSFPRLHVGEKVGSSRKCKCHTSPQPISLQVYTDFTPVNGHLLSVRVCLHVKRVCRIMPTVAVHGGSSQTCPSSGPSSGYNVFLEWAKTNRRCCFLLAEDTPVPLNEGEAKRFDPCLWLPVALRSL